MCLSFRVSTTCQHCCSQPLWRKVPPFCRKMQSMSSMKHCDCWTDSQSLHHTQSPLVMCQWHFWSNIWHLHWYYVLQMRQRQGMNSEWMTWFSETLSIHSYHWSQWIRLHCNKKNPWHRVSEPGSTDLCPWGSGCVAKKCSAGVWSWAGAQALTPSALMELQSPSSSPSPNTYTAIF